MLMLVKRIFEELKEQGRSWVCAGFLQELVGHLLAIVGSYLQGLQILL